jgi:hypothetical protein
MVWEEPRRAQNWWPQLKVVRQGKMRRNSQNRVFEDVRIHSSSYRQNLSCRPIVQHSLLLKTSATRPVRVLLVSISSIILLLLLFLFPLTSSSCLFLLYLHWMDILPCSGYDWTFYWRFIQAVARAEMARSEQAEKRYLWSYRNPHKDAESTLETRKVLEDTGHIIEGPSWKHSSASFRGLQKSVIGCRLIHVSLSYRVTPQPLQCSWTHYDKPLGFGWPYLQTDPHRYVRWNCRHEDMYWCIRICQCLAVRIYIHTYIYVHNTQM